MRNTINFKTVQAILLDMYYTSEYSQLIACVHTVIIPKRNMQAQAD